MNNLIGMIEVAFSQTERCETEGAKSCDNTTGIFMIGLYVDIKIAGESGSTVKRQRVAADDHVANAMIVE